MQAFAIFTVGFLSNKKIKDKKAGGGGAAVIEPSPRRLGTYSAKEGTFPAAEADNLSPSMHKNTPVC
jgi:hypothetical protein